MAVPSAFSNCIIHETSVDFVKRNVISDVHLVQYDDGLPVIKVQLLANKEKYIVPTGFTARCVWNFNGTIPEGNIECTFDTEDHSICYFRIEGDMAKHFGRTWPVIELTYSAGTDTFKCCSSRMHFKFDKNPVQNND